jgi:hypothetical protein
MRSTAYSVMMTLLLLVPISAVPLMAIFGVPQFTPIVSSPLDETDDEEWDRPARKKSRSATVEAADDEEIDAADESLDWTDDAPQRPRPLKKLRSKTRSNPQPSDEDVELSFAESDGYDDAKPSRKSRSSGVKTPVDSLDEESSIQLASNEVADDELPFAESAMHEEVEEPAVLTDSAVEAKIPGYRRQKSASRLEANPSEGKPSSKKKKTAPPTEALSWQKLTQRLNEYGIRNFRLESGEQPGEFSFTCTYTPSNSPHVTRKFEAIADDPLKAVAKVLAQVEEASQQKVMASPRRISESRKPREKE